MKKILLSLAIIASLSSVALASNHSYHSKNNNTTYNHKEEMQTRGILTGIYQNAGCKAIKTLSNGRVICLNR